MRYRKHIISNIHIANFMQRTVCRRKPEVTTCWSDQHGMQKWVSAALLSRDYNLNVQIWIFNNENFSIIHYHLNVHVDSMYYAQCNSKLTHWKFLKLSYYYLFVSSFNLNTCEYVWSKHHIINSMQSTSQNYSLKWNKFVTDSHWNLME